MRLIIEARHEDGDRANSAATEPATIVAVVERQDQSVVGLGLTLAEGRALLAEVQSVLLSHQTESWMADHRACCRCGAVLAHKYSRSIMMRTDFGKVKIASPRLWKCRCGAKRGEARRSVSPLSKAIAQRVSPELEYLQAKWAALLPYRQATELLQKVLPLEKGISLGSTRRRILAIGHALDVQIEHDIVSRSKPEQGDHDRESVKVGCVSVDSAWLSFSSTPRARKAARDLAELKSPWTTKIVQDRRVNIVAGRATFTDRSPRLYAYVHKQVPSAADRPDQFLHTSGVGPSERVTVISDDADEFDKAVKCSELARSRILDWFHIAKMRWTDDGAHCLAQVRVAVLNDEFSLKRLAELATIPCANSSQARQAA